MNTKEKFIFLGHLCLNPLGLLFRIMMFFGWNKWLNDRQHTLLEYRLVFNGRKCDLKEPKLFSEKLQWLKLYERKEIFHQMADKYDAKEYIASIVGKEYVIPTIGLWTRVEDIDLAQLPKQFVLKCTHDSGSYVICRDKDKLDWQAAQKKLRKFLKRDYYMDEHREWQYKGLVPRIIAEPYLADSLTDYKFFCFNGVPKIFQICRDRNNSLGGAIIDFFDIDGNYLEIRDTHDNRCRNSIAKLPTLLKEMVAFSKKLSKEASFMRVDFYEVDGKLYLGELTLHENAGLCEFAPDKYNRILGDWITLPEHK